MALKHTIRHHFRGLLILLLLVAILLTAGILGWVFSGIAHDISQEYARLYTAEMVSNLEAHILPHIALSQKLAREEVVAAFLQDEEREANRVALLKSVQDFLAVSDNDKVFVASAKTGHMYWIDSDTQLATLAPSYQVSETLEDDQWFYSTLDQQEAYNLNIDLDRFLKEMRVWVNVRVTGGEGAESANQNNQTNQSNQPNQPMGVIGTGIKLDSIVGTILERRPQSQVKTILVNQYGAIQMDDDAINIRENSFGPESILSYTLYKYHFDPDFVKATEAYFKQPLAPIILSIKSHNYDYVALAPLRDTQWHVVTFFSTTALFSIDSFIPSIIVMIGMMVVLVFSINWIVHRVWVAPFNALKASLVAVDYNEDIEIAGLDRNDEFGDLARTIRHLTDRMVQSVPVGLFLMDAQFQVTYANAYVLQQLGMASKYALNTCIRESPEGLMASDEDYRMIKALFSKERGAYTIEVRLKSSTGDPFWAYLHLIQTLDFDNRLQYEGILINIESQKNYENQLIAMASSDPLTGIMNRRTLDRLVTEEMNRAKRYKHPLSMIMFDLDHFKRINDSYGHDIGDQVLIKTTEIVSGLLRKQDRLCRWGGEEFVVLLPESNLEAALAVAEKIRRALDCTNHETAGRVTASFGVVEWDNMEHYEALFIRMDHSLLKAKAYGRNQSYTDIQEGQTLPLLQIHWQDRFVSGISEIDQDHRALFEAINRALSEPPELESSQYSTLSHIVKAINAHFEHEEAVLKTRVNMAFLSEHKEVHKRLTIQLQSLLNAVKSGEIMAIQAYLVIIQHIILDHMAHEDAKFKI